MNKQFTEKERNDSQMWEDAHASLRIGPSYTESTNRHSFSATRDADRCVPSVGSCDRSRMSSGLKRTCLPAPQKVHKVRPCTRCVQHRDGKDWD